MLSGRRAGRLKTPDRSDQRPAAGRERAFARWTGIPAAIVLVGSMPVATWWMVGDQSSASAGEDRGRRAIQASTEAVAGTRSTDAIPAAPDRFWARAADRPAGAGWRVPGALLIIFFGGPFVAASLVAAVVESIRVLLGPRH